LATVRILRSTTAGNTPSSLVSGQIAINEADGKLFYRNGSGVVTQFATGGGGSTELFTYASTANFPATGSSAALYLAEDASRLYQWESPVYVEIGVSGGGGSGSSTPSVADNLYLWSNFR
jgi:hypothetical protein